MFDNLTFITPLSIDCMERKRNWSRVFMALKGIPAEWIVVESGSNEAANYPVTRIELESFTRASSRNAGLQRAKTDYVCFIDADMLMRMGDFKNAWSMFLEGDYDAMSPYNHVVYATRRASRIACENDNHIRWSFLLEQNNGKPANIAGGMCFAKKSTLENIGGYDERFKEWGFEDVALDNLLRKAGAKIGFHQAMAFHLWHPAKRTRSQKKLFLKVRQEEFSSRLACKQLEYHITDTCNLHCAQCAHYSNFTTKGMVSVEQATEELGPWAAKLKPRTFYILGGEPTLNKDLLPLLKLCRSLFADSAMELISNGFFLHRHPELPRLLVDQEIRLRVSQHHAGAEYMAEFSKILDLTKKWKAEFPDLNVRIDPSQKYWEQRYHMEADGKAYPFQSSASYAWAHCTAKLCHTIYRGLLWKCPPLAYFSNFEEKLKLHDIEAWDRFRDYQPVSPDCTMQELKAFLHTSAIPACSLCPQSPNRFALPNPLSLPVIKTT